MMRYRVDTLEPKSGKCVLVALSDYLDIATLIKDTIQAKNPELKPRVLDCKLKGNFFDEGDNIGNDH